MKRGLSHFHVMVLTAVDSQQSLYAEVFPGDRRFAQKLTDRIAPGSRICSDGFPAYVHVAKSVGGQHLQISVPKTGAQKRASDKPRAGKPGLGRVGQLQKRLKEFVNKRAYGVSSRNLPLYIAWMDAIERRRLSRSEVMARAASPQIRRKLTEFDIHFRPVIQKPPPAKAPKSRGGAPTTP